MYYYEDVMAKALEDTGYVHKEVKPWNVREGDVILLTDSSHVGLPTFHIPVVVNIIDRYQDFSRPYPYKETARTHYRFYHKPVNPDDLRFLYDRHKTEGWNRFDTVEIWRKK